MPLLDIFHPPLSAYRHWEGLHSKWANVIVDTLNERLLPERYFAEPHIHFGPRVEVDVATLTDQVGNGASTGTSESKGGIATRTWTPVQPTLTMSAAFPDTIEVQVLNDSAGPVLVGAIEFVSPGNKDRASERRAFAIKCASYLTQGVGVIIVDVVTDRLANLHDEIVRLLPESEAYLFPGSPPLYATAYRPLRRKDGDQVDVWLETLAVGAALPTLPLALAWDLVLPIGLETTYCEACRKLRIEV